MASQSAPWQWFDYVGVALYSSIVLLMLCLQWARGRGSAGKRPASEGAAGKLLGAGLLLLGVVPVCVLLASLLASGLLVWLEKWSIKGGWQYVAVGFAGLPLPFVAAAAEPQHLPRWLISMLEAVTTAVTMGLVSGAPCVADIARRLSQTAGGLARFLLIYMPMLLLGITCSFGSVLSLQEGWQFRDSLGYAAATAFGLAGGRPLTAASPGSSTGQLLAFLCGSVVLGVGGVAVGVVAAHPVPAWAVAQLQGSEEAGAQGAATAGQDIHREVLLVLFLGAAFASVFGLWRAAGDYVGEARSVTVFALLHSSVMLATITLVVLYRSNHLHAASLRPLRRTLTFAMVVLLVVPSVLLSASFLLGAVISLLEQWHVDRGFEHVLLSTYGFRGDRSPLDVATPLGVPADVAGGLLAKLVGAGCMGLTAATARANEMGQRGPQGALGLAGWVLLVLPLALAAAAGALGMAVSSLENWPPYEGFGFAMTRLCQVGASGLPALAAPAAKSLAGRVAALWGRILALPLRGAFIGLLSQHGALRAIAEGIEGREAGSGYTLVSEEPQVQALASQLRGWSSPGASPAVAGRQAEAPPEDMAASLRQQLAAASAELAALTGDPRATAGSARATLEWRMHHLQQELYDLESSDSS